MVCERDLGWVLLPRLPVYLHGHGVPQHQPHLPGLAHAVRLPQPHLHLRDVETGEDTEHLQLAVTDKIYYFDFIKPTEAYRFEEKIT